MNQSIKKNHGYMTVGEVAKKMNISVRTLQYYDKEAILSPSALSEGGRRLYTNKDLVHLHQILSLKSLGFSLKEIKNLLIPLDDPVNVAEVLTKQIEAVQKKIEELSAILMDMQKLKEEVLLMDSVDFKKIADIIMNLQMKNEFYSLIKCFDEDTLDHVRNQFDQESGQDFLQRFQGLLEKVNQLHKKQIAPASIEGQCLAEEFWSMIMEFTGGDMQLVAKLVEINKQNTGATESQTLALNYISEALEIYFEKQCAIYSQEEKQ